MMFPKGETQLSPIRMNVNTTGMAPGASRQASPAKTDAGGGSFAGELQAQILKQAGVKLSAHAQKRLAERNVQLGDSEQARLCEAVDRVGSKGADRSLVLMDDLALLVSARNRTVITAVDARSATDGVFTNIDSAVII